MEYAEPPLFWLFSRVIKCSVSFIQHTAALALISSLRAESIHALYAPIEKPRHPTLSGLTIGRWARKAALLMSSHVIHAAHDVPICIMFAASACWCS